MHLEGTTEVETSRRRTWDFLIDPRNLAECVPGSPQVERVDDTHYRIRIAIGGGLLRTNPVVDLALTDVVAPERATLQGSGGAMGGSVQVATRLELSEIGPDRTSVAWSAEVTLGGTIAGFGAMIEAPVRTQLERTLVCIRARLDSGT